MPKFKHKPVVGGTIFVTTKEGVKSAKIIAQSGSTLTIDPVIPIEPDDICVIHAGNCCVYWVGNVFYYR